MTEQPERMVLALKARYKSMFRTQWEEVNQPDFDEALAEIVSKEKEKPNASPVEVIEVQVIRRATVRTESEGG